MLPSTGLRRCFERISLAGANPNRCIQRRAIPKPWWSRKKPTGVDCGLRSGDGWRNIQQPQRPQGAEVEPTCGQPRPQVRIVRSAIHARPQHPRPPQATSMHPVSFPFAWREFSHISDNPFAGILWSSSALLPLSRSRQTARKSPQGAQLPLRVLYFWAGAFRLHSEG